MSLKHRSLSFAIAALIFTTLACQNTHVNKSNAISTPDPVNEIDQDGERNIQISSPDGAKLAGTFLPSTKQKSPAVLLLHQWQSDRHSYDDLARLLNSKGFNVLAIDGRGFGESTSKADGTSIAAERSDASVAAMLADVRAAYDFLAVQKNVDPTRIGIVGASYSSSLALMFAAADPRVKAVALLSPGLNYFGNMQTEPAVVKYGDRPLLLVAAEDDKESAEAAGKLKAAGGNDKYETKIYQKGGHGTGLFKAKVGLEDLLETFLTKSLSQ